MLSSGWQGDRVHLRKGTHWTAQAAHRCLGLCLSQMLHRRKLGCFLGTFGLTTLGQRETESQDLEVVKKLQAKLKVMISRLFSPLLARGSGRPCPYASAHLQESTLLYQLPTPARPAHSH